MEDRTVKSASPILAVLVACCATAVSTIFPASEAAAADTLVEGFTRPEKFALVWPTGKFDHGEEEGFSWVRIVTDGKGGSSFAANVRSYSS